MPYIPIAKARGFTAGFGKSFKVLVVWWCRDQKINTIAPNQATTVVAAPQPAAPIGSRYQTW